LAAGSCWWLRSSFTNGAWALKGAGRSTYENAALHFALSVVAPPQFSRVPGESASEGFDPIALERSTEPPIATGAAVRHAGLKNVVVFVLESVGSHYLDFTHENDVLTPGLNALSPVSAFFPNTYAHAPSSAVALFTLLSSLYPLGAAVTMPEADPKLPVATLVSELKARGYRTGFFFSAGWDYAGYLKFVEYQGADMLEDHTSRQACEEQFIKSSVGWAKDAREFAATRDACTAASMIRWIAEDEKPFFTVLWTDQTHFPYRLDGTEVADMSSTAGIQASEDRYLRAIGVADEIISSFVAWLELHNFMDETLIVIVGDHGQAFGQHGRFVHGPDIYDDVMRVPLIFINPRLFSGTVRHDVVGHIDVAPTIMEALGLPSPPEWQGVSLFGSAIRRKTFFLAPWGSIWMGYRHHMRKINYEVSTGVLQDFDLASDPEEQINRVESLSDDEQEELVGQLWAWKEAVDQMYERLRIPGRAR
jgi:lipoteichoic acid synthase